MKIGYTNRSSNNERELLYELGCRYIVERDHHLTEINSFEQFVRGNIQHEMVIVDLASIGTKFTINQLYPILTLIKNNKGSLIINEFSKKMYFPMVCISSYCTKWRHMINKRIALEQMKHRKLLKRTVQQVADQLSMWILSSGFVTCMKRKI